MTAILLAATLWATPTDAQAIDGLATYYAPRLMQTVAANRGMDLTHYAGGVALNRAGDLGRTVWLEHKGVITGPYLVVDCARRGEHFESRERKDHGDNKDQALVVEVRYRLAREWRMAGPVPVKVWFELPEMANTLQPM